MYGKFVVAITAALLLGCGAAAHAALVTLYDASLGTLPSAQGWTFAVQEPAARA